MTIESPLKTGRIFVRSLLDLPISLRFQSETSKENLDGYWNLGEPKIPFTLVEGQEFTLSLSKEELLYEGTLETCPWASWNQDRWILSPPKL